MISRVDVKVLIPAFNPTGCEQTITATNTTVSYVDEVATYQTLLTPVNEVATTDAATSGIIYKNTFLPIENEC